MLKIDHTMYDVSLERWKKMTAPGRAVRRFFPFAALMDDAIEYWVDTWQRTVLYQDVMRKRGNIYFEHKKKGMPPVLDFDYEVIMDGRKFPRPVNYALARVLPDEGVEVDPTLRPIVVIDPRAGHGPGIGGSKRESMIGNALKDLRPTYFIFFYPDPSHGQTLEDVKNAEIRFIEEVREMHPDAPRPAVIGNCQAGWAVAMLAAEKPELTGPIVVVGSPLSYWAGKDSANPMRYKGGLIGGTWPASLWADLGNGRFDGAHLVMNFEDLNPANTFWKKKYHLYSHVDTEEERFLGFERWWNGFFLMNEEEIQFITQELFVGNKLEQGTVEFKSGNRIDLKNLEQPVVVFCSDGDNITPPQQALNWVAKVWGTADNLKRHNQVVVYLVHKTIGHLGIFVSGSVARREHQEILRDLDKVQYLEPGLYEMVIEDKPATNGGGPVRDVRYEPREFTDIMDPAECDVDEQDFEMARRMSVLNERLYQRYLSPLVEKGVNEYSAMALRAMHPLRAPMYAQSDLNPAMHAVKAMVPTVKKWRRPASEDNAFVALERIASDSIAAMLDYYRDKRDLRRALSFRLIYGNPMTRFLLAAEAENGNGKYADGDKCYGPGKDGLADLRQDERARWIRAADQGGFKEAVIRVILAVARADGCLRREEFEAARKVGLGHPELSRLPEREIKRITLEQARILQTDLDLALDSLGKLAVSSEDRRDLLKVAHVIAASSGDLTPEEREILGRIEKALDQGDMNPQIQ